MRARRSRAPARAAGDPGRSVRIEARAKLNLGLAVGPRRPDGFHELATIFQSISLADTLIARPRPRGFTLRVRHENAALRGGRAAEADRKSTRLNSSHERLSRMPSSA